MSVFSEMAGAQINRGGQLAAAALSAISFCLLGFGLFMGASGPAFLVILVAAVVPPAFLMCIRQIDMTGTGTTNRRILGDVLYGVVLLIGFVGLLLLVRLLVSWWPKSSGMFAMIAVLFALAVWPFLNLARLFIIRLKTWRS